MKFIGHILTPLIEPNVLAIGFNNDITIRSHLVRPPLF
jgi:hypothetical protein